MHIANVVSVIHFAQKYIKPINVFLNFGSSTKLDVGNVDYAEFNHFMSESASENGIIPFDSAELTGAH